MLANPNAPSCESEAVRSIQSHVCPHPNGSEVLGVELVEPAGLSDSSDIDVVPSRGVGERYLGRYRALAVRERVLHQISGGVHPSYLRGEEFREPERAVWHCGEAVGKDIRSIELYHFDASRRRVEPH